MTVTDYQDCVDWIGKAVRLLKPRYSEPAVKELLDQAYPLLNQFLRSALEFYCAPMGSELREEPDERS